MNRSQGDRNRKAHVGTSLPLSMAKNTSEGCDGGDFLPLATSRVISEARQGKVWCLSWSSVRVLALTENQAGHKSSKGRFGISVPSHVAMDLPLTSCSHYGASGKQSDL